MRAAAAEPARNQGIFRIAADPFEGGAAQRVLSQEIVSLVHSTTWGDPFGDPPTTLIGSSKWADFTVAASVRLPSNASDGNFVGVATRHGHGYEFSGTQELIYFIHAFDCPP